METPYTQCGKWLILSAADVLGCFRIWLTMSATRMFWDLVDHVCYTDVLDCLTLLGIERGQTTCFPATIKTRWSASKPYLFCEKMCNHVNVYIHIYGAPPPPKKTKKTQSMSTFLSVPKEPKRHKTPQIPLKPAKRSTFGKGVYIYIYIHSVPVGHHPTVKGI